MYAIWKINIQKLVREKAFMLIDLSRAGDQRVCCFDAFPSDWLSSWNISDKLLCRCSHWKLSSFDDELRSLCRMSLRKILGVVLQVFCCLHKRRRHIPWADKGRNEIFHLGEHIELILLFTLMSQLGSRLPASQPPPPRSTTL